MSTSDRRRNLLLVISFSYITKGMIFMSTAYEILKEEGKIAREVIAAESGSSVIDLSREVEDGAEVLPLTFDDLKGRKVFWHTASHILAAAVKRVYPDAKLTIGPSIDNGFYYDIDSRCV